MRDWETETELCLISQGYKDLLWRKWLLLAPSPFFWFNYEKKLNKLLGQEVGKK